MTRSLIIFLLPLGRGIDDLIVWVAIGLSIFLFVGGLISPRIKTLGEQMKRYMRRFVPVLIMMAFVPMMTGCYINTIVEPNEVGVRTASGSIKDIAPPGRYNGGLFSSIHLIDVAAKTNIWSDADLVTADKQPIGLTLGVTYARKRDTVSVRLMYERYRSEALDDAALWTIVQNRVPRIAKQVTAQFTLNEMLGIEGETQEAATERGRELVSRMILELLEPELAEFGVELLDVGVNNIAPDEQYLTALKAKAAAQIGVEVAKEETKRLEEQELQEIAQTAIDVEKARRQNLVNEELAKTYEVSDRYYELERLKLMPKILGDKSQFWFVQPGTDLMLMMGEGGINPAVVDEAAGALQQP